MGCWEDICLKILCWLFLILSDYVENCLNLCPSSARRGTVFGRLRAAAYDYLRLARSRLYRYHFDGNYSIFPYGLIEFRIIYFFELNGCRNNIFIILRYVDGGIPLRHPSWFSTFFAGWWWWWWWWRWTWKWWGYIETVIFAWFRPRSHASRAPSFQRGRNLLPHGLKAGLGRFFAFWST